MDGTDTTSLDEPAGDQVLRLGRPARATLTTALLLVAGLFLAGTFYGSDDWWPFGPWRMYATSTAPTTAIAVLTIEARQAGDDSPGAWRPADLEPPTVGLNRAEIEGRMPAILADPSMLATLIESHSRLRPDDPAWTAIRIRREERLIENGRQTGETRTSIVAQWPTGSGDAS
ncbi:hypothetical protein KIH74_08630 [Kineosporia sp. J2-2]|uniref:Uncharacterized protein n=1 Tax=Kineosporia corallincola TaxID=2835133 RepID=A0ABS5TEZ1_9ACTN|nr:hypothetical protein [Kineosporia corallincola]MBT0768989.1 hypothetical protein [Kineosporia corallincola]